MAFGGGINPNTTSGTAPPGTGTRGGLGGQGGIVAPFVPETNGTAVTTPKGRTVGLSPIGAGLFGGIQPESVKAAELRELLAAKARQAETFNPTAEVSGPLYAPEYELGLPQPVGDMPKPVARRFMSALGILAR